MKSLRLVANESPFNVTVYHHLFPMIDQYLQVFPNTLMCIVMTAAAVFVFTLIFIPNFRATLVLIVSVIAIIEQVMGFMVVWGIYLDVISMVQIIMCIGFSVDYCAHICNHFYSTKASNTR